MFSTDKFLLLFLCTSIHMLYFPLQTVGFQPYVAENYILPNAIYKLPVTQRCYSPSKANPLHPGWDRPLSWPYFHPSACNYLTMTAETPSNVLNQLWELYPQQILLGSSEGGYFRGRALWNVKWGKKYVSWSLGEITLISLMAHLSN